MGSPTSRRWIRASIGAVLAAAALCAGASPASAALEPVPHATVADADRIGDAGLAAIYRRQREDGLFDDATQRLIGSDGMPALAWVALRQARHSPDARAWRLQLARKTLAHGSGTSVLQRWPLAMTVAGDLDELLDEERVALRNRVLTWGPLRAAGIADRCYQRARCFNNYKLADAVLNLELARSGIQSLTPRTRLYSPTAIHTQTRTWLARSLPAAARVTGTVSVPGRRPERAAILSDPETRPLAYHALCTAWAVRATVLLGDDAPRTLRAVTRRALWGLLGVAAPNGEIAWSGRGQDQLWSLSASLYAAAAGSRLFADTDPILAGRLRRLVDIEMRAIDRRAGEGGALQVLPSGNQALSGLDHYYTETGSSGLGLLWLELSRDELPDPAAPRMPLPSEVDRSIFSDAPTTGLVTRRWGRSWMGLRLRRDHEFDPRQDFGLMRALRREGGVWREQRPSRPRSIFHAGRVPQAIPTAGPMLRRGGARYLPVATKVRPIAGGVEMTGEWRSRSARKRGRWRFTASRQGVSMAVPCPRRHRLELTEWLPRDGELSRTGRSIARGGYRLGLSRAGTVHALTTDYANSRQPSLSGYRVTVRCSARWLHARWSGGAPAGA